MRALAYGIAAAALLAGAALAAVPGPDRALTDPKSVVSARIAGAAPVPIEDLYRTRSAAGALWTRDGKSIVYSANTTGRLNLWKVAVSGGEAVQLTKSDERQLATVLSPDGKTVVFQSDYAGNEDYDLFSVSVDGGAVTNLTNSKDVSEQGPLFSADGKLLAFARKAKAEPTPNLWVMDMATGKSRAVTKEATENHAWRPVAFTADGKALIADRGDVNSTEAAVYRIDLATGEAKPLTEVKAKLQIGASDISPDGRWLAVTSNARNGQAQAAVIDLKSGALRWLEPNPWSEETGDFSPDGKVLSYSVNADGRTSVHLYDLATGKTRPLSFPAGVDVLQNKPFSPDGKRILVSHQASNTPPDYWAVERDGQASSRLTQFAPASLDPARLPSSSIVHYVSQDGTVISAVMLTPPNLQRDGKAPGVVLPHGGPTGQTVDSFSRTALALASRGYVVIAPNPRGSTGYGQAFQDANIKDLGGGDLVDEVYAAKFITATGYVDPAKIGITGGSYGGFMTLMAIGKTPDVWAAAVEQYGIINWFAMLEHEDALLQQYERGLIGDPVKDKAIYDATSPMTYIKNAKAPLLVLQGDNDIRVPKGQAEEVVATLKAAGRTVDAHYYANEGHGFAKRENQIDALQRTIEWFDRYLKPKAN